MHSAFNEAMLASRPPPDKKTGGAVGGTQHQQELPDRGDEDGPARPGKGRGRGRRRPGKRQRETASADQDHDQDWRRGRWGRHADDGGDDHNDRGTGGRGQWKWQQWPTRRDGQGRQRREEAEDRRQARPGGGHDRRRQGQRGASPESDSRGEVPDRRGEPVRVRPAVKRRRKQVDYVLLSFFDGIGAAPAILEHTHGKPLAAFAWEIDEACIKLTKDRLPWLRHRGDLTSDDPAAVAAAVKKADPEGKALIVVTAAPPCQDFSRIGQSPGQRGALFLATAEFYWKTRSLLPDRRWAFLFENVVMEPAHSDAVSKALGVDPIMVCASDFGWISRPRLWWLYPSILQAAVDPASGKPLHWAKHGSYRRLRLEEPRQSESELVVDDLRFHPAVAAGRLKLPCATTMPAARHRRGPDRSCPRPPRPGGRPIPGASHDVHRIRQEVLAEIAALVEEMADDTAAWLARRSAPVRATHQTPGKKRHTQIPVILELLRRVGYPDMPGITDDLTNGFVMLGEVRRAPGWRTRTDGRYSNPASLEQLAATNWVYVKARTSRLAAGTLAELVEETRLGRVVGPTRAPPGWNLRTTAVLDRPGVDTLVPPPPGQHFVAASFPIVQTDEAGNDKIRRGEDWRRSGHNSTIRAHDVPTHHFVDDYVDMIRRLVEIVGVPEVAAIRIFGHDLMNAYRQWPVRDPAHSGTFLAGPHGVTMWFHVAMCFGAAASVWNFNRTADALQALKRVLLWIVSGHFVDDFNGVDIEDLADGAFHGMAQFFELLGLQTKPSKAQAPAPAHVVQGVLVAVGEEGVVLKPTPERIKKVTATIDEALRTDEMTPEVAGKLAGRLNFITQATFGALGKAALKPVYSRAHDAAASASSGLSAGLRAALRALKALLADIQPRVIPYIDDGEPQAIIYADAFYQPGETRYKAGHFPAEVPVKPGSKGSSGWGFVVRIGATVFYDCGTAPADFLDLFASRRAFIYVLEILAQVLALVTLSRQLPARWLAFIDNVAGNGP